MTAAYQPAQQSPFAEASPARVRAALIPEEAAEFDRQWADVMARATRDLDLTEVIETLESRRRIAWITTTNGTERHRQMLASAEERVRTGDRHPDAVPWDLLKTELGISE